MEIILRRLLDNINKANSREQVIHIVDEFDMSVLAVYDFNKVLVTMLALVEKLPDDRFVWFLEACYQSKNKRKFDVFCYLFYEYSEDLDLIPRIEKIKLPKVKFAAFLPTIILVLERANSKVAISVLLVLIDSYNSYDFSEEEKKKITKEIEKRLLRILEKREKNDGDISNLDLKLLEILIDASRYFNNDLIFSLIIECLKIQDSEILLFSVITLLINDIDFDDRYILAVADDNEVCTRLFDMMKRNNLLKYFPMSRINQEYLAKLEMISWLEKSEEFGKAPDDIVCEGTYDRGKLIYYVFKFRDSEFGREWKVGIAGGYNKNDGPTTHCSGETYSIFEKYKERLYYDLVDRILTEVIAKNNRQQQEKIRLAKQQEEDRRKKQMLEEQVRKEQLRIEEFKRKEEESAQRENELTRRQYERRMQIEMQMQNNKLQARVQSNIIRKRTPQFVEMTVSNKENVVKASANTYENKKVERKVTERVVNERPVVERSVIERRTTVKPVEKPAVGRRIEQEQQVQQVKVTRAPKRMKTSDVTPSSFIEELPKTELRASQQRLLEQEQEMRRIKAEQERDRQIRQQQLLKEQELQARRIRSQARQESRQRNIPAPRGSENYNSQVNARRRNPSNSTGNNSSNLNSNYRYKNY